MMIYDSLSKSQCIVLINESGSIENRIKDLPINRGRANFLMAQNFQSKELTMNKEETSEMLDNKSWFLFFSSIFSCLDF